MAQEQWWKQALGDVQSGRRTDFTRKTQGPLQSFEDFSKTYRPITYGGGGRTQFDDYGNPTGKTHSFATDRGTHGFAPNAEAAYLSENYNLPSYQDNSLFSYGPMIAAGTLGAYAGGLFGGAGEVAGGGTALPDSYWSMTADAGGLSDAAAANAGTVGSGAGDIVNWGGSTGTGVTEAGMNWLAQPAVDAGAIQGSTAAGRLFGLGQTGQDLLSVGGAIAPGVLGYFGAGKQADAYRDVANQNLALGAPYRGQLEASYKPGFDLMSQPGYGDAFNRAADIATRQWSTRGNPAGNPTLQAGILNDVWSQNYLPALANYRGQLGQFSGLGLNTSGLAQLGGAQTAGGQYDAIGLGLGRALNPQPSIEDLFRQYGTGGNNYQLTIGGIPQGRR